LIGDEFEFVAVAVGQVGGVVVVAAGVWVHVWEHQSPAVGGSARISGEAAARALYRLLVSVERLAGAYPLGVWVCASGLMWRTTDVQPRKRARGVLRRGGDVVTLAHGI
jgi:hypothetical protein